jgi:hypothetical protein
MLNVQLTAAVFGNKTYNELVEVLLLVSLGLKKLVCRAGRGG